MKIDIGKYSNTVIENHLSTLFNHIYHHKEEVVFLCVGTPKIMGDSFGPYIGTLLRESGTRNSFGTLAEPVNAKTLDKTINTIKKTYNKPYIIAIDSCFSMHVAHPYLAIKESATQPGAGLGKKMPAIGDLSVLYSFGHIKEKESFYNPDFFSLMKAISITYNSIIKK